MFKISQISAFSVDIGFESLKIIQLKKMGSIFQIVGFSQVPIPNTSIQKNKIIEKSKIVEALKEAQTTAKPHSISANQVISALPEHMVFTKIIQLPRMKENEIAKTIPFEATEFLPISLEDTYLDWQILNQNLSSGKLDILVIAAPKTIVNDYINLFKTAGLELIYLETKPIAAARALVKNQKEGVVIIDIGAHATGISVFDQGNIRLTGTTQAGSNGIDVILEQNLGINKDEAKKIKIDEGLTKSDFKTKQLIEQALLPISEEIIRSIKYYQNRIKTEGRIAKILLCGGGASLAGVVEFFKKQTGIETELGNPYLNLHQGSDQIIPKKDILKYTAAIGLSLKELK